jgi:hypothetical protein
MMMSLSLSWQGGYRALGLCSLQRRLANPFFHLYSLPSHPAESRTGSYDVLEALPFVSCETHEHGSRALSSLLS